MIFPYIFMIMAIILIDQGTKYLALKILEANPTGIQVTDFFALYLVWNDGVAFSFGSGEKYIIIGISLTISLICLIFIVNSTHIIQKLAYTCLAGGGFANLIDRFSHDAVVDFLYFHHTGLSTPIFNIADIFIMNGFLFFIIYHICPEQKKESIRYG